MKGGLKKMEDVPQETQEKETQPEAKDSLEKKESTTPVIDAARKENDRKEKLLEEEKALMDRKEKMLARQMLGGRTEAGATGEKEEIDPVEFSKKLQHGEIPINDFLNVDGK